MLAYFCGTETCVSLFQQRLMRPTAAATDMTYLEVFGLDVVPHIGPRLVGKLGT